MRPTRSKLIAVLLLLFIVGGLFAPPRTAHAQFKTFTTVLADIPRIVSEAIQKGLKTVVAVAYKSGLQYFLNRVAYDVANNLAFGCPGGKPCFMTKPWKEYLDDVKDEALGEFFTTGIDVAIDEAVGKKQYGYEECSALCCDGRMEQDAGSGGQVTVKCANDAFLDPDIGCIYSTGDPAVDESTPELVEARNRFNQCIGMVDAENARLTAQQQKLKSTLKSKVTLCSPISADIYAKIELTARSVFEPQRPQCRFSQIRKALPQSSIRINGRDIFRTDYRSLELKDLPEFAAYFNPVENDIGATLTLIAEGYQYRSDKQSAAEKERATNKDIKPTQDPLTGAILTPAQFRAEAVATAQREGFKAYTTFTGEAIADAFKLFTNTLVSKFFQRIVKKGFNPEFDRSLATFGPQSGAIGFTRGAQLAFADILKTDFTTDTAVDLLADLTSCPPQGIGGGRGPENCVMTEQLRLAIENKLSLKEAVEPAGSCPRCQGLLSRNLTFGFEASGTQPDFRAGLPYRSIVILRKHRIVPVGWELAALYIKNFSQTRVTLGELIDAYDQCGQNGGTLSPYCRLIDPNWVLKAPLSHCYREGSSEENVAALTVPVCDTDTNGDGEIQCPPDVASPPIERQSVCADQRSCIVEGGSEGCQAFGYCTKEKQVWTIEGESCPAQFASCLEVTKVGTDERRAFVMNTTDSVGCTRSASVGCRRYAKVFDAATGGWVNSLAPNMNYYLNQSALDAAEQSCKDARAVGCTEYLRVRHLDEARRVFTQQEYIDLINSARGGASYSETNVREALSVYLNAQATSCKGPISDPGRYVGCSLYQPRDVHALSVPIPAKPILASINAQNQITAWNDECPSECVGYRTFEQMATNFESGIALNPGVNMIPLSARQCPAQDAGCDEFTNLDEVAKGGEGREYYTELRACEKPGSGEATYYTWQGSDTTGFQLKVWPLMPGAGGAPLVTGPKLERVDPTQGWDGIDCQGDFRSISPDYDCREFIDTALNYYYRYFSKTILASDDCHPLRRTRTGVAGEQADCSTTGGAWTSEGCLYQGIPRLSRTCSASSAGCREYRGSDGGATQVVFADTFEGGSYEPWYTSSGNTLTISTESALRNNHSLRIPSLAVRPAGSLTEGQPYLLTFWAKADAGVSLEVIVTVGPNPLPPFNPSVSGEWQRFALGPMASLGAYTVIQLRVSGTGAAYVDNVVLQTANVYAIKNSWVTPASCDQDPPGTIVSGAHVGCAAYGKQGREGDMYFRRFTDLCPEEFAGCEALVDTKNSTPAADDIFYENTASAVTVEADELAYLIPSEAARCEAQQAGCTVLGQAGLQYSNSPGEVATTTLTDVVIKVDPDDWSDQLNARTSLCTLEEEYCAGWSVSNDPSSVRIFKDPMGLTCEFKTENNVSAWFKTGTSQFCPSVINTCSNAPYRSCTAATQTTDCPQPGGVCRPLGHCVGGRSIYNDPLDPNNSLTLREGNLCTQDADCLDFARPGSQGVCSTSVAYCPAEHSTCTEYQDPQLPEGCSRELVYGEKRCKNNSTVRCVNDDGCPPGDECSVVSCDYYYVPKNAIQDALQACPTLNPEAGCVGLHETGGPPDSIITTPHCSNAPTTQCRIDADCPVGGQCGYQ